jgi:hypothetical protein
MPIVPAFCDSCGAVFPSGIFLENVYNAHISNNRCKCPSCGEMGHTPDGVFNFVKGVIEVISAPQRTIEDLIRFEEILRTARESRQSTDEVSSRIKHEVPSLSSIADLLPQDKNQLYGFLGVMIAGVTLVVQLMQQQQPTNITINQVITHTYQLEVNPNTQGCSVSEP